MIISQRDSGNSDNDQTQQRPDWRRTLGVFCFIVICFAFEEIAVLPALPTIQRHMQKVSTSSTALLESGFLIVAAMAAPLIGKLGDRYGKQRMLLVTLAIYFVGATGAAAAPNFSILIIFRAMQGVGGALVSLSFSIMRDEASDKLSVAIGWIVGAFGIGACLGLGLSGIITTSLSWRYLFGLESLLIIFGFTAVATLVPKSPERADLKVDYLSVMILGTGLACIIMGVAEFMQMGWPIAVLFPAGVTLIGMWIWHENRIDEPLLEVRVLTEKLVLLPNIGSALGGYALFTTFFLVPRLVQLPGRAPEHVAGQITYGFSAGAGEVGLYLLPVGIGILLAGPSGGVVGRRVGGKWPFTIGLGLIVPASALLALAHQSAVELGAWLLLLGAGFGLSMGAAGVFITEAVAAEMTGVATAFNSLVRLITGGIGSQIAAVIIKSVTIRGSEVPTNRAFVIAFGINAVLALVGTGVALMVPNPQRQN